MSLKMPAVKNQGNTFVVFHSIYLNFPRAQFLGNSILLGALVSSYILMQHIKQLKPALCYVPVGFVIANM